MTVEIKKGTASGIINAPASKSMAHRMLICGAFSKQSRIKGIDFSDDISATIGCLKELGADVQIDGNTAVTGGLNSEISKVKNPLFCNESGSTLRFILPVCLLRGEPITLTGTKRLFERSLSVYEEICRRDGIEFIKGDDRVTVCGRLKGGSYEVRGDISSQFISGLLFALPTLSCDSLIRVKGRFESASYVGLTIKALDDFGVKITRRDDSSFEIPGGQSYCGREIAVEGDYSNAAFFEAFNLFGGSVSVNGLDDNSLQGDRVYKKYFELLGQSKKEIDLTDCPDLGPILFALAAAKGGAIFYGTRRLKIKESDRAKAMAEELSKFGVSVKIGDNTVEIGRQELKTPNETLNGHNDHRIVMALSILCTLTGGKISGAQAVNKSFPDFFSKLSSLGIEVLKNELG